MVNLFPPENRTKQKKTCLLVKCGMIEVRGLVSNMLSGGGSHATGMAGETSKKLASADFEYIIIPEQTISWDETIQQRDWMIHLSHIHVGTKVA